MKLEAVAGEYVERGFDINSDKQKGIESWFVDGFRFSMTVGLFMKR